jgi:serine/threonine-protein kinase HipA
LLYSQGGVQLAPLYDVLSTAVYPELSDSMAMKIGSKYRFAELHKRHWVQMAEEAQLGASQLKRRVLEIAGQLPNLAKGLQAQFEAKSWDHPILAKIVSLIEDRSATTANRFSMAD